MFSLQKIQHNQQESDTAYQREIGKREKWCEVGQYHTRSILKHKIYV